MELRIVLRILIIALVKCCTGDEGLEDLMHDSIYVQPQQVHLSIGGGE